MKNIRVVLFSILFGFSANIFAHDLWVMPEMAKTPVANIIYGHNFPNPETIAPERTKLFAPVKFIGEKQILVLKQTGKNNWHFTSNKQLKKGTYIVYAEYKPTAWIKKASGKWEMNKTRKDTKEKVEYCGISTMAGKAIFAVGKESNFSTQPLGKGLEITPLQKVSSIKVGKIAKFKLTKDGKAIKRAEVYGSVAGFASNDMSKAFYAKTDLAGEFEFKPLTKGAWYFKTAVDTDTKDKDCEIFNDNASFTFIVK